MTRAVLSPDLTESILRSKRGFETINGHLMGVLRSAVLDDASDDVTVPAGANTGTGYDDVVKSEFAVQELLGGDAVRLLETVFKNIHRGSSGRSHARRWRQWMSALAKNLTQRSQLQKLLEKQAERATAAVNLYDAGRLPVLQQINNLL